MDDNITDDVVNIDNELIKTKDYIKIDKIKNAYVTEISEIPINKKYDHDFTRNQNYHYLVKTKQNSLLGNLLSKHNSEKVCLDCC